MSMNAAQSASAGPGDTRSERGVGKSPSGLTDLITRYVSFTFFRCHEFVFKI